MPAEWQPAVNSIAGLRWLPCGHPIHGRLWDTVRVLIISRAVLFREGLRNILSESSEVEVVGMAPNVPDALQDLNLLHPDVVVLDRDDEIGAGALDRVFGEDGVSRLVVLSLRDNRLGVYSRDSISSPSPDQLLTAVLTGSAASDEIQPARAG